MENNIKEKTGKELHADYLVRQGLKKEGFKIVAFVFYIAIAVVLYILFSRSLFQGFIALVALIILFHVVNKK